MALRYDTEAILVHFLNAVLIFALSSPSPHFSPIDFFLGLRQFGGLLEMLEASNRVY
jgi:hypothetical protein